MPEGVRLVISRRLERLGDEARRVLSAAAIIGRSFPLDILGAIADVSEDTILDVVEQAERAQLAVAERSRDTRYAFVHELIRSTLIDNLSLPRRQRLHLKVAEAVERLRAGSLDAYASMLAHHFYQAGAAVDDARTAEYLLRAGRRAQQSGAFEEALELAERLLGLELTADGVETAQGEELKADALAALNRMDEAIAPAARAFELWRARKDDGGIARTGRSLSLNYFWQTRIDEAFAAETRALDSLSSDALAERARVQSQLAVWGIYLGKIEQSQSLITDATTMAERLGDPRVLGEVLGHRAQLLRAVGAVPELIPVARRALSLLDASQIWLRAEASYNVAAGLFLAGRFGELDASLAETENLAGLGSYHNLARSLKSIRRGRAFITSGDLEAFGLAAAEDLAPGLLGTAARIQVAYADFLSGPHRVGAP